MVRIGVLMLLAALASAACSQGPATAATAAPGELRFKITFKFDDQVPNPDIWTAGSFTTTATLPRSLIDSLTATLTDHHLAWPSTGKQSYGDFICATTDECLTPCVGGYDANWTDTPQLALVERSGGTVVLSARLSASPKPNDNQFLGAVDCPPVLSGGQDGFPPMEITIDGLDSGTPTFSVEVAPDFAHALQPDEVYELTISPA